MPEGQEVGRHLFSNASSNPHKYFNKNRNQEEVSGHRKRRNITSPSGTTTVMNHQLVSKTKNVSQLQTVHRYRIKSSHHASNNYKQRLLKGAGEKENDRTGGSISNSSIYR